MPPLSARSRAPPRPCPRPVSTGVCSCPPCSVPRPASPGSAAAPGAVPPTAGPRAPCPPRSPPRCRAGTSLKIASYQGIQQLQFKLAKLGELPFTVSSWLNIGAGPDVINAFRAKSLDLANNAGIPPIQAHYQGFDAKIVAINITRKPNYVFATKPGSDIRTVAGLPGQEARLLPGPGPGRRPAAGAEEGRHRVRRRQARPADQQPVPHRAAVGPGGHRAARQQPGARLPQAVRAKGAHAITTDVVDLLTLLWAPAVGAGRPREGRRDRRVHPALGQGPGLGVREPGRLERGVLRQDAEPHPRPGPGDHRSSPTSRCSRRVGTRPIKWEQETADLLAEGGFVKKFDVDSLFDRRFEGIAAKAVAARVPEVTAMTTRPRHRRRCTARRAAAHDRDAAERRRPVRTAPPALAPASGSPAARLVGPVARSSPCGPSPPPPDSSTRPRSPAPWTVVQTGGHLWTDGTLPTDILTSLRARRDRLRDRPDRRRRARPGRPGSAGSARR